MNQFQREVSQEIQQLANLLLQGKGSLIPVPADWVRVINDCFKDDVHIRKALGRYFKKNKSSWYQVSHLQKLTHLKYRLPEHYVEWKTIIAQYIINYMLYHAVSVYSCKAYQAVTNNDAKAISYLRNRQDINYYLENLNEQIKGLFDKHMIFFLFKNLVGWRVYDYFMTRSLVVIKVDEETVLNLLQTELPANWQSPTIYESMMFLLPMTIPKKITGSDDTSPITVIVHDGALFSKETSEYAQMYEVSERVITIVIYSFSFYEVVRLNTTKSFPENIQKNNLEIYSVATVISYLVVQLLILLANREHRYEECEARRRHRTSHERRGDPLLYAEPHSLSLEPIVVRRYPLVDLTGKGQGKKKRPHLRKAHWHTVRCGKGREQYKRVWMPMIRVNSED